MKGSLPWEKWRPPTLGLGPWALPLGVGPLGNKNPVRLTCCRRLSQLRFRIRSAKMRNYAFSVAVLCMLAFSGGERASAQQAPAQPDALPFVLDGHNVRVTSGASVAVVDLGCEGRTSLRMENKLFVTCGADGVVEIDLSNPLAPQRTGWMPVDGDATGLFLRDGRVWVEIAHVDARPLITKTPLPASMTPTTEAPPRPIASATARAVAPAVPTPPKPSLIAPPRHGGIWELSAMAGAFINLGPVSGGATGWASVVYRFDVPIVVRAELAPFGLAIGNSQTVNINSPSANPSGVRAVAAGHLLVGLDTQFIEVAVGGGGATISNSFVPSGTPAAGGPSIVEEARVGARDGLALNVESITVAVNGQFEFASFVASIQVPLTQGVMLIAHGGGGNVGLAFGDLAARVIVQGDGGPDTIALTGYFGGAGIDFQNCTAITTPSFGGSTCESTSLGGPSIGGGVEWRR
jgi:hypothetical protein